jgi:hypothetical protein
MQSVNMELLDKLKKKKKDGYITGNDITKYDIVTQ